jgi:hypothetical protein
MELLKRGGDERIGRDRRVGSLVETLIFEILWSVGGKL